MSSFVSEVTSPRIDRELLRDARYSDVVEIVAGLVAPRAGPARIGLRPGRTVRPATPTRHEHDRGDLAAEAAPPHGLSAAAGPGPGPRRTLRPACADRARRARLRSGARREDPRAMSVATVAGSPMVVERV